MALLKGAIARLRRNVAEAAYQFQFNPGSMSWSRGARWDLRLPPGGFLPLPGYGQAEMQEISFELLLYGREIFASPQYVLRQQAFLDSLVAPHVPEINALGLTDTMQFVAPPLALLVFGPRSWTLAVQRVRHQEDEFDSQLNPTRVTASIEATVVFTSNVDEYSGLANMEADIAFSSQVSFGGSE